VLIISHAWSSTQSYGSQYSLDEIEAIEQYMKAGHGLIGTGGTLADYGSGGMGPNMKKLAPLFGLVEQSMAWSVHSALPFVNDASAHPVMNSMPSAWSTYYPGLLGYMAIDAGKAIQLAHNQQYPHALISAYEITAVEPRYDIAYYGWDIDGDEVDDLFGPTPSHIFPDAGEFDVTLTIVDEAGHTASDTVHITVLPANPTVDAGPDQSGSEGTLLSFQGTIIEPGAGGPYTIEWDFGDGTTPSGTLTPTHTYTDNGTYTVTLTVTDANGGVGSDTLLVTVTDVGPTAAFIWAPTSPDEGAAVQFTDASTSSPDAIVCWEWSFGSLGTSTEQNPSFTFMDHGTYTVTLTVTDDDGSTDTISHDITITDLAPIAASWSWDFGSLGTSTDQHPIFTFMEDGTYTVTLTVTDEDGSTHTISYHVTIADLAPTAAFSWAPEPQTEGLPVQFTDGSSSFPDTIVAFSWDFAGLGTSSDQNPSFTFMDDGIYPVRFTVTDEDGSTDTISHDIMIADLAPIAAFTWAPEPQTEGSPVQFTDGSTSFPDTIVAFSWDFAGLGASALQNPSFTFMDDGTYTVTLTVTDDDGSTDTVIHTITINNVAPSVDAGPDQTVNEGDLVTLDPATFTDAGTADTHTAVIDWGDGTVEIGVVTEAGGSGTVSGSHAYADNGAYTVTVTVTDDDGAATADTLTITVLNVAPSVEAGADQTADEGTLVSFSGIFTDPGADTHTVHWDFGDGTSASGTLTPGHIYADDGVYTVTLTVTDDDGGVGDDTLTMTVLNVAPTASIDAIEQLQAFALPELTVLILDPVFFEGSATDPGADTLTYYWTFGDGEGASGSSTTHSYGVPDTYPIILTVEDDDGGISTASVTLTVWGPQDLKTSVISDLGALKTGEWWVDKRLDRVLWYIEQSLNEKYWLNETHLDSWYGSRVFFYELLAEIHLEIRTKLYSHFIPMLEHWIEWWQAKGYDTTWLEEKLARMQALVPVFEAALFKLAKADELLARIAIMGAENTPVQNSKWQHKVDCYLAKAARHMTKAAERLEEGHFAAAICHYKTAWMFAQQAMKWANKTHSHCWCWW
jgi:PKD repeat protein